MFLFNQFRLIIAASKLNDLKQQVGLMDNRNTNEMTIDEELETSFMRSNEIGGLKSEHGSLISFSSSKRSALDTKNREEVKRIEREKKEQVEVKNSRQ